jgi:hypothetical protein
MKVIKLTLKVGIKIKKFFKDYGGKGELQITISKMSPAN